MTKIRKKDLHFTLMRLRDRVNRKCVVEFENTQEIQKILRTLRLHGEGHMAQDLTPQFKELCEKVTGINDRLVMESRAQCDQNRSIYAIETFHKCQQTTNAEIFDKLRIVHTCHNHAALQEDRKRIIELEEANAALWERGTEADAGILSMLKALPEIEILKTQVAGLLEWKELAESRIHHDFKETENLKQKIAGLENRLSRAQDFIAEMHKEGFVPVKTGKAPAPHDCATCKFSKHADDSPECFKCSNINDHWQPKKPAAKKPAKKAL